MTSLLIEVALALGMMTDTQLEFLPVSEVVCLADNIYHEARGEEPKGQFAVAYVTMNRAADDRWPDSICEVVHQDDQFSWTKDVPVEVKEPGAYESAVVIALIVMSGVGKDPTNGATFFYNPDKVAPGWSRSFEVAAIIGNHKFLR